MNKAQARQIIKGSLKAVINSCKKYKVSFEKILDETSNLLNDTYNQGYEDGENDGYNQGYEEGHNEGLENCEE